MIAALILAISASASSTKILGQGGAPQVQPRIEQRGLRVRLIVSLRSPAARLDRAAASQAQAGFLDATAAAGIDAVTVKRFSTLPLLVVDVAETEAQRLAALPDVTGVQVDVAEPPSLAESTVMIGAPAARSSGATGAGWSVAVIDTGVDAAHPFLGGRVVAEACYSTSSASSTSLCPGAMNSTAPHSAAPCASSDCDHGTHVAGIAAGSDSTLSGVAPAATIIAIQAFSRFVDEDCEPGFVGSCVLSFVSDQLLALERVYELRTSFNIAAVNMSLGAGSYTSHAECDSQNGPRREVINRLRAAGIAVVASSGNSAMSGAMSAPACISGVVSVGSVRDGSDGATPAGTVSSFSNTAPFLSLLAPVQVITSSVPAGGFARFSGTSMAAAHVSGAWAALKSRAPSASVATVLDALRSTGTPVTDPRSGLPTPSIRVDRALSALTTPCTFSVGPTSADVPASGGEVQVSVSTTGSCAWTVASTAPWITSSRPRGTGPGSVRVLVAPNPGDSPRRGHVVVAEHEIQIVQVARAALTAVPGDFDADQRADLVWQHQASGDMVVWKMNGITLGDSVYLQPRSVPDSNWQIVGSGDLNRDGSADLVWRHATEGWLVAWLMNGVSLIDSVYLEPNRVPDPEWEIVSVADMDLDGLPDLLWRNRRGGWLVVWYMNGTALRDSLYLSPDRVPDPRWRIAGAGDLNGDGSADLVWRHAGDGTLVAWFMRGAALIDSVEMQPRRVADLQWRIAAVLDIDGDGAVDLVWQHGTDGTLVAWLMSGITLRDSVFLSPATVSDTRWRIIAPK